MFQIHPEKVHQILELVPLSVQVAIQIDKRAFIAGGVIREVYDGVLHSDIDVQCECEEAADYVEAIADGDCNVYRGRWFSSIEEAFTHYSFTVCQAAVWYDEKIGWIGKATPEFFRDIEVKQLIALKEAVDPTYRQKFLDNGYYEKHR